MKRTINRRGALVAAATAVAGSVLAAPRDARATTLTATATATAPSVTPSSSDAPDVLPAGLGVDIRKHAALVVGADWTQALRAAVAEAAQLDAPLGARVHRAVLIPAGTYSITSVEVPRLVKIVGVGADVAYYGDGTRRGGTNLVHVGATSGPMLDVTGPGVTLESLTLVGNGVPSPALRVTNGFESYLSRVRVVGVPGTALHVEQLNNNWWEDVSVNDCGSATQAAVVIKSPKAPTNTNTVTIGGLTIEGAANVALDIGWGASTDSFVEFVRLSDLHVEGVRASSDALIRIGNVRHLEFVSPFVYGGGVAGPLVEYRARPDVHSGLVGIGGVTFLGGMLLGTNEKAGVPSTSLVRLTSGNDVKFVGTRFANHTAAAITVAAGFGPMVAVDSTCTAFGYAGGLAATGATLVDDGRPAAPAPTVGRPVVRAGSQNRRARGMTVSGSDEAGTVAFGTASDATAGEQVKVVFATPLTGALPMVLVTPGSKLAASAGVWVGRSSSGFTINFAGKPARNAGATAYRFSYVVVSAAS